MTEQASVVEKRIQRTVIRRRVQRVEEEEAPAPDTEKTPGAETHEPRTAPQPESAAGEAIAQGEPRIGKAEPARGEQEAKAASPGAAPQTAEKKPIILGTIDLAPPKPVRPVSEDDDEQKLLLKKVVKKKSRSGDDLDVGIEGVGRISTLGQLARLSTRAIAANEPEEAAEPVERVFKPSALSKKKRVIGKKGLKKPTITLPGAAKRVIKMGESMTVLDLAKAMGIKANAIVQKLAALGTTVGVMDRIDTDTAVIMAQEFKYEIRRSAFDEQQVLKTVKEEGEALVPRPPVITVMGHVDHGKTSLLDAIRQSNVAAGEAGGITQHMGAYRVKVPKGTITFLDTPGHEAFTTMRARGASVTDLVILVVAADEGVMPQTIESIRHAQAAKVPIIVAINKMDKEGADPSRVKRELAEHGLVGEEWGGDTVMVPVSAQTKAGVPDLLEMILLQADLLEFKANCHGRAEGVVIEARLDKGRGPIATVLIQSGTLKRGDVIVAGSTCGKVRAMTNDQFEPVTEALPSDPVEILGLDAVPNAGDDFVVVKDEKDAKLVTSHRASERRTKALGTTQKVTLENLFAQVSEGDVHELKLLLKADVQGSVQAVREALVKLATDQVKVTVIHSGVGAVTESDVLLASASNALIVGFNVRPETKAIALAEREGIEVKMYRIIYELLDQVKLAMEGLLEPTEKEVYCGRAEVRQTFTVSKVGLIAGCYVLDGKVGRSNKIRLLRDNVVIADVQVSSLKRFKDDVREVQKNFECGIGLEGYADIKAGDVLEAYVIEETRPR